MPLTFFEVDTDPDRFQYFLLEEGSVAESYELDGRPLSNVWCPPAVYSYQPRLPEADFWDFGLGAFGTVFAIRPEALIGMSFDSTSRASASFYPSRTAGAGSRCGM